ncbi:hypothetical protein M885DRAFT_508190 [Pelagophyceae sp. CCMP2097]|nr:hypothetical protein M885DRAFT_508190 [Pelagophyceae sp. CCMP2097]
MRSLRDKPVEVPVGVHAAVGFGHSKGIRGASSGPRADSGSARSGALSAEGLERSARSWVHFGAALGPSQGPRRVQVRSASGPSQGSRRLEGGASPAASLPRRPARRLSRAVLPSPYVVYEAPLATGRRWSWSSSTTSRISSRPRAHVGTADSKSRNSLQSLPTFSAWGVIPFRCEV